MNSSNRNNESVRSENRSSDSAESHQSFYRRMQRRLHRIRKGIEDLSSKRALVKSTRRGAGAAADHLQRRAFHFEETAQGEQRLCLN